MKKFKLVDIVENHRQNGNSTWLVKAAIENPECIILVHDANCAKELESHYYYLLDKAGFFKKLKWKLLGRKHPKFLSKNANLDGYNLPIILDNSAVYE
jgi:hypothetical protein